VLLVLSLYVLRSKIRLCELFFFRNLIVIFYSVSKRILFNVFSSSGQVLITGIVYFFLYRLLLMKLGIELLGVWSVVLATSSIANIANFGMSSSVTRFVALYISQNSLDKIKQLIFTSSLLLTLLFTIIAILIFPFSEFILEKVIVSKYISEAYLILPYSILCLVLNSVTGVYSSALEGLQLNYVKNIIVTLSSIVLISFVFFFITPFGLLGVAYAQVIQSVFTLLLCLIFVLIKLPHNPLKWRWSSVIFKELFSYGLKFQVISFSNMLNDPLTKVLLTKFGGLEFTGFYEMANRLVMQLRSVIVNANQSLIPVMVGLENNTQESNIFYKKTFLYVFIFSVSSVFLVCLSSGIISMVWIGAYQIEFITCLVILAVGFLFNLIAGPAYFAYMASGRLNVLVLTHLLLSILNGLMGFVFGDLFGGPGVVMGWSVALICSSISLILIYQKLLGIGLLEMLSKKHLYFVLIASLLLVAQFELATSGFLSNEKSRLFIDLSLCSILVLVSCFLFINDINYVFKKVF
jgi:O-antigen/teichoic acid export membrane protein